MIFQFVLHARPDIKRNSGDYSTKVPPLPIPNREVKLRHADGTAYCGRVGSRRLRREILEVEILRGFFAFISFGFSLHEGCG